MSDQRNLIVAIVLSVVIILGFQFLYEAPRLREQQAAKQAQETAQQDAATRPVPTQEQGQGQGQAAAPAGSGAVPAAGGGGAAAPTDRAAAIEATPRLRIDNGRLHGSLSLKGGRIDDVTLADYHATIDPASPEIELLNPVGAPDPYFAEFGWVPGDGATAVPGEDALWKAEGDGGTLKADAPVTLAWDNGQGLAFQKRIGLDRNYMFEVERSVTNNTGEPVTLYPYSLVSRWGTPHTSGYYILHEGPIGAIDGKLNEVDYKDLVEDKKIEAKTTGGWLGFTDKYWLASLVPPQDGQRTATFRETGTAAAPRYQVDYLGAPLTVAPGETASVTDHFFAGAKEVDKLDAYSESLNIPLFDRAVDFGWFYFLTKPMFHVLDFFYRLVGNYGIAILLLTLCVKLVFFPLANKSYRAMSQMKKLQPEMTRIREQTDDKAKMQQEMMALYKREKVNPMSGCLPIVVQIPVFFSLYKVLFVSIEMRHAPFYGWIHDLSAPDPTSVFNLFGLIPFTPPHFLMIGVWPLLMGFTMWLQQRLNPQPADPTQAKVMSFLPVMFTFLFATFPAGLVIYWTWNNTLSIIQQRVIMWRMGVKPG
ncbi:MAG: membrane protein insertase YidC [Geminicoccaceae bacterium]|nr:membrane protein insertase YidC [Geminicoccaceae bacterium]